MFKTLIKFIVFSTILLNANDFKIKNLENPSIEASSFPYFTSKRYSKSAKNINIMIQYFYFNKLFDKNSFNKKYTSPFLNKNNKMRTLYIYDFKIIESNNYISISISTEGCGAYCESYNVYFNFDKYTGEVLTLNSLFDKNSLKKLENLNRNINIKKITPFVKKPISKNKEEIYLYQMYKDCLNTMKNKKYYKLDMDTSFLLLKDKLKIIQGRCSNHAMRALDDIGTFVNTFTFEDLKPYLNKNTKKYLTSSKYKFPKMTSTYKIWKGKINNKYPITLFYIRFNHWEYWYDKYKESIRLKEGSNTSKSITLYKKSFNQTKKEFQNEETFILKKENDTLKGIFKTYNSKDMSVYLKLQ